MILFYDTETTGFARYNLPPDHPSQPYLVQIAMQLVEDSGEVVSQLSTLVKCPISIPSQASDVHGISDERSQKLGVKPETAIKMFDFFRARADVIVAHNIKFDSSVMASAFARSECPETHVSEQSLFCTMEASSPILNLPPTQKMIKAGFNHPKPPKLEECVKEFFGEDLEGAHDALVDVAACRRVYFHLKSLEGAQ